MSRLSTRGVVAAFTTAACLVVALIAAAGGESMLVVGLSTVAGGVAGVQAVRDRRGTVPSDAGCLAVAALCGLGALGSLPDERWFTAVALAGLGAMNFGRGVDWRVAEADDGQAAPDDAASAEEDDVDGAS